MIREEIKAAQYDNENVPDTWQIHGTIFCKVSAPQRPWRRNSVLWMELQADIEGVPEISISLILPHSSAKPGPQIENFILDPRVQAADSASGVKKLTFSPPLGQYPLCTYIVTSLARLPLRGFYQMKVLRQTNAFLKSKTYSELGSRCCRPRS